MKPAHLHIGGFSTAALTTFSLLLINSCITTESSYETTSSFGHAQEVENELKTPEDWERWHKQQQHNKNALIIIE